MNYPVNTNDQNMMAITAEEYMKYLSRDDLSMEEQTLVQRFETNARMIFHFDELVLLSPQDEELKNASALRERTQKEAKNDIVEMIRNLKNNGNVDLADNIEKRLGINQELTRKLAPPKEVFIGTGGFITSGILIFSLINIGIIIAATIIARS